MSRRHGPDGESSYKSVSDRFDSWSAANPRPKSKSALGFPEVNIPEGVVRTLALAVGLGVGALLLVLAATAYYASSTWGAVDRSGAALAYALVGLFLTIAGLGASLGTLNHIFRVLRAPAAHH
ncbi:MAG: hypothetical protein ICV87_01760 [Gemmatimonadetes bacterium]|nr:hypothetical protein [Gemmatimonadota bacterium]